MKTKKFLYDAFRILFVLQVTDAIYYVGKHGYHVLINYYHGWCIMLLCVTLFAALLNIVSNILLFFDGEYDEYLTNNIDPIIEKIESWFNRRNQ